MTFTAGTKLGPYEILSAIGAGGQGEVYKARDTRLNRTVAIKVLSSHFSDNAEMKARFEREAQTIAGLNHPHICVLYDVGHQDGTDYLVMEYLEGQTLAARLEKGALPLDDALRIAIEIADALDRAHRQGVVHRDLKPLNVMLTKSGAKLLDFGLAKLKQETQPVATLSAMPTNADVTAKGAILGTLQYMSPEQLEGQEADARSDIFAFGAMLYEMVTGKKAFEGKSQASLISAIMKDTPPPPSAVQPMSPIVLDYAVRRCLEKDADDRWQTAREVLRELKWATESSVTNAKPIPAAAPSWRERLAWIFAAVSLIAVLVVAGVWIRTKPEVALPVRFGIPPTPGAAFGAGPIQAISPDGHRIVFIATAKGSSTDTLWIRPLDSMDAHQLRGTEGTAQFPFWSPDSRFIGFFAGGKLKKIDIAGGPPQTLCDTTANEGGAWNRDGIILLGNLSGGLFRVSAAGGQPTAVTALDASRKEFAHQWPSFLPDGRHFLFMVSASGSPTKIYVGSLDTNESKELVTSDSKALYASPGFLLFPKESTLMAQPFDAAKLKLTGDAFPIVENVRVFVSTGRSAFSLSDNGILTYRTGGVGNFELVWFDRTGKPLGSAAQPGDYRGIALSPDEKRVAVHRHEGSGGDIWLIELLRETAATRFTFNVAQHYSYPVWAPDGSQIAFLAPPDIYHKVSSGAGNDDLLVKSERAKFPTAWSRDGRFIIYHYDDPKTKADLWVVPTTGDRKPFPFLKTEFNETFAEFSPDGHWVAYTSDESGKPEIYVQSFPASAGKWKISANGGALPRWRKDGKEIFFISPDRMLWSVDARAGTSTFEAGVPKLLFETRIRSVNSGANGYPPYDVSADGRRFLITSVPDDAAVSDPITVVLNWQSGLTGRDRR